MPRRSPLDTARQQIDALAYRPKPKNGRDRSWEQRQRDDSETTQVSYRGIRRALNERIKELAQAHNLTVSEVAGQLLALGLEEVESGRRELAQDQPFADDAASGKTNP